MHFLFRKDKNLTEPSPSLSVYCTTDDIQPILHGISFLSLMLYSFAPV